jgi:hypothetical protein
MNQLESSNFTSSCEAFKAYELNSPSLPLTRHRTLDILEVANDEFDCVRLPLDCSNREDLEQMMESLEMSDHGQTKEGSVMGLGISEKAKTAEEHNITLSQCCSLAAHLSYNNISLSRNSNSALILCVRANCFIA